MALNGDPNYKKNIKKSSFTDRIKRIKKNVIRRKKDHHRKGIQSQENGPVGTEDKTKEAIIEELESVSNYG